MDLLKTATLILAAGVEGAGAIVIGFAAIEGFLRALLLFVPGRDVVGEPDAKEAVRLRLGRLTVRFIVHTHKIRSAKDAMARQIVRDFRAAGIGIASATDDIVGFPRIEVRSGGSEGTSAKS